MATGEDAGTVWLTLSEASSRLGITVDALRSRVRRGQVTPRRGNDGRLLVPIPADIFSPSHDRSETASAETDHQDLVAELHAELLELRVALAKSEAELGTARATTAAEVQAVRAEVVAREAMIEQVRTALEHERARADRLETALTEARRPWLARVVETLRQR